MKAIPKVKMNELKMKREMTERKRLESKKTM